PSPPWRRSKPWRSEDRSSGASSNGRDGGIPRWTSPRSPRSGACYVPPRLAMSDTHRLRVSREIFLAAFGPAFDAVEPWVTDRVTAMLEEEDVCAGESLFTAGDPPDYFYFLRKGTVQ